MFPVTHTHSFTQKPTYETKDEFRLSDPVYNKDCVINTHRARVTK